MWNPEGKSFEDYWAEMDATQKKNCKVVMVLIFVCVFVITLVFNYSGEEFTILFWGNFWIKTSACSSFCFVLGLCLCFLLSVMLKNILKFRKKEKLKQAIRASYSVQAEREYMRQLDELENHFDFTKEIPLSVQYMVLCLSIFGPGLAFALSLYFNMPLSYEGGQVQKSEVLSVFSEKKRGRKICFPVMVDGKQIEFEMDQFDRDIQKGMKLSLTVSPGKLGWPVISRVYVDTIGVGWQLKGHRYDYIENEQKKAEWKVKQENAMQKTAERNVPQQMAERNVPQQTLSSIDELIVHRLPNFAGWREAKLSLDRERPCPVKLLASKDSQEDKYCNLRLERRMLMVRDTVERVFLTTCHFPCRSPYSEKDKAAGMNLFNEPGDGIVVVNPILLVEMWESKKITVLFDGDEYRTYAVARCTANPNYLQIINSKAFLFRMKKAYSAVILFSADKNHTNWRFGTPR